MPTKKGSPPRRGQGARHEAEKLLQNANPIEMGLFGLGGYYLGDALNQTGVPQYLYDNSPAYKGWVDAGYSRFPGTFGDGGGKGIVKVAGVATLADSLRRSAKGSIPKGVLNAELPFSLGAMLDAPEQSPTSSGGRW